MTTEEILRDARWELCVWDVAETTKDELDGFDPSPVEVEKTDCHLIGPRSEFSAKVQDDVLEVRKLIERRTGFQRWAPAWTSEPPHASDVIGRLLVELGVANGSGRAGPLSTKELIDLVETRQRLRAVAVSKRHLRFDLGDAFAEVTDAQVDDLDRRGAVMLASTNIERLSELRATLGLEGIPNVPLHVQIAHMMSRFADTR